MEVLLIQILGPALAKAIFEALLGNNALFKVAEEFIDYFRENKLNNLPNSEINDFNIVITRIATSVSTIFKFEANALSKNEQEQLVYLIRDIFNSNSLNVNNMISLELNPERLSDMLILEQERNLKTYSLEQQNLVRRVVNYGCQQLVDSSSQLPGWYEAKAKADFMAYREINNAIALVSNNKEQEWRLFEYNYRQSVVRRLSRFEPFGIDEINSTTELLNIRHGFVSLTLRVKKPGYDKLREAIELAINNFKEPLEIINIIEEFLNKDYSHDLDLYENWGSLKKLIRIESKKKISKSIQRRVHMILNDLLKPLQIELTSEESLANLRRIVLQGDAGFGKTTILRWLAVHVAGQLCTGSLGLLNNYVPFYIRLRKIIGDNFPVLNEIIQQDMPFEFPSGWVESILSQGRALILIDGVDELSKNKREALPEYLTNLINPFQEKSNRFIITSRPAAIEDPNWHAWQNWVKEFEFAEAEILALDSSQIKLLVTKWYESYAIGKSLNLEEKLESQKQSQDLQIRLGENLDLYNLASTPLVCAMLCALNVHSRATLPETRLQLYEACTNMFLTRRDLVRRIPTDVDYSMINEDMLKISLQEIAYNMMDTDSPEITQERALYWIHLSLQVLADTKVKPDFILDYLVERSSLMAYIEIEKLGFVHKTFQEYFAARYMVAKDTWSKLYREAPADRWRETTILITGMLNQPNREQLLNELLDKADIENNRDLSKSLRLLALSCLAVSQNKEMSPLVRERVIKSIRRYLPPKNESDVRSIAQIGDPVVNYLLPARVRKDIDSMRFAVKTLALIGTTKAIERLEILVKDNDLNNQNVSKIILEYRSYFDVKLYDIKITSKLKNFYIENSLDYNIIPQLKSVNHVSISRDLQDFEVLNYLKDINSLEINVQDFDYLQNILKNLPPMNISQIFFMGGTIIYKKADFNPNITLDFSQLAKMKDLTSLSLRFPRIVVIKDKNPKQLVSYKVRFNGIPLQKLKDLLISSSTIDYTTIFINSLENLTLENIDEIDFLELFNSFPNIKSLSIFGGTLMNVGALQNFKSLKSLSLVFVTEFDLSEIYNLKHLEIFEIISTWLEANTQENLQENLPKTTLSIYNENEF